MIRLQASMFAAIDGGGLPEVQHALQQAIALEHFTIPPYLYALYSLGESEANAEVAEIVRSVAVEEMLHMTLACNVLNSIGGKPQIDHRGFIPNYPDHPPGGVRDSLIVPLASFSKELVKDVFMEIEEPESPVPFPVEIMPLDVGAPPLPPQTIGQFYALIIKQLQNLGESIFTGDPKRQIPSPFDEGAIVTDLESAIAAINLIVEQGEGTPFSPLDTNNEPAHYYRFAGIYFGKKLRPKPGANPTDPLEDRFIHSGKEITFDAAKIATLPPDPRAEDFPQGTRERRAIDTFNYSYTGLLKALHRAANGEPRLISQSVGLMMSLRQQALDMMSGRNHAAVGPTFQYQPINPPV